MEKKPGFLIFLLHERNLKTFIKRFNRSPFIKLLFIKRFIKNVLITN